MIGLAAIVVLVGLAILAAIPWLVTRGMAAGPVTFSETWRAEDHGLPSERLVLTTSDGLDLVAHAVPVPAPKAVVIFLSGIHNPSVTAFFGHAAMLWEHGYASLLLEMRAHGESEGERIALGFEEWRDVQAAVRHLRAVPRYQDVPIVAYGLSMGGATAINATGLTPEIDAVISLSAYSSWSYVFVDAMGVRAPVAWLQRPFVTLYTNLAYGFSSRHVTPKKQIRDLGDRPALLIHSRGDSEVPFASLGRLVAHAPAHVETWVREGDAHFIVADGAFLRPWEDDAYQERIVTFLNRHVAR